MGAAALVGAHPPTGWAELAGLGYAGAYAVLGVAFFTGSILVSCDCIRIALACDVVALVADTAARRHFAAASAPAYLAVSHLVVFAALLATLLALAYRRLGVVARHR